LPRHDVLKGVRVTGFYDADHYVKDGARNRFQTALTFEHKYVNMAFEYFDVTDQPSVKSPETKGEGWDVWVTPRLENGWEALLRYDSLKPNKSVDAKKNRTIAGVSYWFKTQKSAALLADYEHVSYDTLLAKPNETRYSLHCLFNF